MFPPILRFYAHGFRLMPVDSPLPLRQLRTLTLPSPLAAGRPPFLSAASGLVWARDRFFVVADDELQLGVFSSDMQAPGATLPLLAGALPPDKTERKRVKPDFETLACLPPTAALPHGALLALGSGSRANRALGVLWTFADASGMQGSPLAFDCTPLYGALEREFGIVNIEGCVVQRDQLLLLQRGNKKDGVNAIVHVDLQVFASDVDSGAIAANALIDIARCELGAADGVALGFTDAACLPDGELLALAVAEDTDDPYADGAALASYLCRFDRANRLRALQRLQAPAKTEGIALWARPGADTELAFVTDADDPAIPSLLLAAKLP